MTIPTLLDITMKHIIIREDISFTVNNLFYEISEILGFKINKNTLRNNIRKLIYCGLVQAAGWVETKNTLGERLYQRTFTKRIKRRNKRFNIKTIGGR